MYKVFLPYDVYERHKKVSEFIEKSDSVLDVGGELNHLSQFIKPKNIIVANLDTGDVLIKKTNLPFKQCSFDVVCAIDVLEHIPKKNREKFINDLLRVAQKKVILSFPIGTIEHTNYERKMQTFLVKKGINVTYLKEHIKYGLPQREEIEKITKNFKTIIYYSGIIKINEYLFKLYIFDPTVKVIRKLIYYFKLLFNLISNPFFYFILSKKPYSKSINRAYLIIFK